MLSLALRETRARLWTCPASTWKLQQVTRDWWATNRVRFALYASQVVLDEAAAGDPTASTRRLASAANIPLLDVTAAAGTLAQQLQALAAFPAKAGVDALHVIERACRLAGYRPPVICTPDELMGDS